MEILTRSGEYQTRAISGTIPWGSTAPPTNGQLNAIGGRLDETGALQQLAVYSSVSLISDSISSLPIKQYRLVAGEAREMDPAPVIARPWSEMEQQDFISQGTVSMLLRGDFWGKKIGLDERGLPDQVQIIHPKDARIRRLPSGVLEVRYFNEIVPPDQVTRRMALSVPGGIQGMSPIEYLRTTINLARQQDIYANAFLANEARPGGWISVEDDLDEEETKAMMLAWNAAHQGPAHANLPGILTGGAEFHPITMSMADAQFLEQMKWSESRISGRIFRIPPHMVGDVERSTSWGNGIEQQMLGYVRDCLGIWLRRWEDLLRSWLPPRQFVLFDLSDRLRGDALQRWSAYQIARVIGVMNGAEIRRAEGMPKVTEPAAAALLEAYDTPFTSSPVKALSSSGVGPGGDKAD